MPELSRLQEGLNAFVFRFDAQLLAAIRQSYETAIAPFLALPSSRALLAGGRQISEEIISDAETHHVMSYGIYPLLWISCNDLVSYGKYERFYRDLELETEVRKLVDCKTRTIVYCGFFVVGDRSILPNWHVDYQPGANAYTLITPLYALDAGHGQLRYQDANGRVQLYRYQIGEAVIFGEGFEHATQPYRPSKTPRVLVSLTFGTDRMVHWPQLSQTIGSQSRYLMLPNGIWTAAGAEIEESAA